ncbi:hypothetical protein [Saccharothrix variisporea]|uniref:Uncharacterized protein n=1 Tax=Saccharothrix variisporea TaxID=543527 RepID=A0A495XD85_9PSEU|nr:hypothetical protein [Saccharothrix variisporea]RKT71972.1 hypothetical protein DFJ66_5274 [Saccharothrix variisporea]
MTGQPPGTARAAVALWYALAAFGLVNVAYLWVRRGALVEVAAREGFGGGAVTALLLQLTAVAVVFGAGYVVFGRMLRLGKPWARRAVTAVALLHVVWLLLSRSASANLVVVLLIVAGCVLTWLRGTAEWVKQH